MQQENKHLDLRNQFYLRMARNILDNPDAAYTFMEVVCNTVSIADLPMIETIFKNAIKRQTADKN